MTDRELVHSIQSQRPQTPPGFALRQDALLQKLMQKEEKRMKKKCCTGFVLAAILLLTALVAVAEISGLGVLDFISRHPNAQDISPKAQQLIQKNIPQSCTPNEYASFEIREAAYDGHNAYIVIAVTPLQENIMLFPSGLSHYNQMKDFVEGGSEEFVSEYAYKTGKQLLEFIIQSKTPPYDDVMIHKQQCTLDESGTLLLLFALPMAKVPEAQMMQATIYINEPEYKGEESLEVYFQKRHENSMLPGHFTFSKVDASVSELSFQLDYVEPLWIAQTNTPVSLTDPNVTITKLQITATPFASYIDMDYQYAKQDSAFPSDSFLHVDFLLNGDPLDMNLALSPGLFQKSYTVPEIYPCRHYGAYSIIENPPEDIGLAFRIHLEDPETRMYSYQDFPPITVPLSLTQ